MESYERAWAETLAQEHAHQQELLSTLRGELGSFASECAAALTALDAVVGLAGIGSMLDPRRRCRRGRDALGLSGGSGKKQAVVARAIATATTVSSVTSTTPTPTAPAAPMPRVSPVNAVFEPAQRATFYAISATATGQGTPRYAWQLSPPKNDPTCTRFGPVPGSPNRAVWRHADTDGCNHALMGPAGHLGTVTVTMTTIAWQCIASFFGTNTQTGSKPPSCRRL